MIAVPPNRVPFFVLSFNRLTWLRETVNHVHRLGGHPIIVDNNSSYPPLIEFLDQLGDYCTLIRNKANDGSQVIWEKQLPQQLDSPLQFYGVTDPDLDLSTLPANTLGTLIAALERANHQSERKYAKIGPALSLQFHHDYPFAEEALRSERPLWAKPVFPCSPCPLYDAPIDTTFCLCDRRRRIDPWRGYPCLRVGPPYMVDHRPWRQSMADLTDEDLYYHLTVRRTSEGGFHLYTEQMTSYLHVLRARGHLDGIIADRMASIVSQHGLA